MLHKTDAHAHIIEYGFMVQLPLATTTSVQGDQTTHCAPLDISPNNLPGVVDRIKHYILAHPDIRDDKTKWISGMGWDQTKWSGTQFPTAVSFLVLLTCALFSLRSCSLILTKILSLKIAPFASLVSMGMLGGFLRVFSNLWATYPPKSREDLLSVINRAALLVHLLFPLHLTFN